VAGAPSELGAVACVATTTFCVAGGGTTTAPAQVFTSSNDGASWTPGAVPSGLPAILGISCPSTSDCSAVGTFESGFIAGTSDGGSNWDSETVPGGTGTLSTVSCPSVGKCYGVGQAGNGSGLIIVGSSPLTISTSSLPAATIGSTYSQPLSAEFGNPPYTWKLASGKLPKGLRLSGSTGVISGTPSKKAMSSTFTVEVLDTKTGKPKTRNTATATFTITVS
jgi:large repetitive protein